VNIFFVNFDVLENEIYTKNTIILINLSSTATPTKFVSADEGITDLVSKYANVGFV